jgi:hypothetical protein
MLDCWGTLVCVCVPCGPVGPQWVHDLCIRFPTSHILTTTAVQAGIRYTYIIAWLVRPSLDRHSRPSAAYTPASALRPPMPLRAGKRAVDSLRLKHPRRRACPPSSLLPARVPIVPCRLHRRPRCPYVWDTCKSMPNAEPSPALPQAQRDGGPHPS